MSLWKRNSVEQQRRRGTASSPLSSKMFCTQKSLCLPLCPLPAGCPILCLYGNATHPSCLVALAVLGMLGVTSASRQSVILPLKWEDAAEGSCSRGCVSASAKLHPSREVTYLRYAPASRTRRSSIEVFDCVRRIDVLSTGWIVCFVSGCLLAPALECTTSEEAFYTSQSDPARQSGSLACDIWNMRCYLPFGWLLRGCLLRV
jgi:hypothetical protein